MTVVFYTAANYIDFDDIDKPLKKVFTIVANNPVTLSYQTKFSVHARLAINSFVSNDSWWNDIWKNYGEKNINYMTIEETVG